MNFVVIVRKISEAVCRIKNMKIEDYDVKL